MENTNGRIPSTSCPRESSVDRAGALAGGGIRLAEKGRRGAPEYRIVFSSTAANPAANLELRTLQLDRSTFRVTQKDFSPQAHSLPGRRDGPPSGSP